MAVGVGCMGLESSGGVAKSKEIKLLNIKFSSTIGALIRSNHWF